MNEEQELLLSDTLGGFNFSPSFIAGSLIFGVVGLYFFRRGKRELNFSVIGISIALMAYPIFVSSAWQVWLIGGGLSAAAYHLLNRAS